MINLIKPFQLLTDANRARITSIGSIDINDDGTCSIENCLNNPGHRWCKLTAVCKKLTGLVHGEEEIVKFGIVFAGNKTELRQNVST